MSADKTLDIVVRALATQANVSASTIDTDKPLSAVAGIESVKALRAITDIEDECDVVIPDDFLFETATVRELADFVASLAREGSSI
ncbi:acyl carrier protein [Streptomyces sp. NBC_00873]|uniref:acyl carrier protein n=1 Tax=unclassified Streptomyces TaxID=2593676 RepID=UPI0038672DEA|nr:acyl carrier protein [Streptomyces sp. NBC_00873]WTA47517.1 acyl carrier protein [Streptomyces sp. NBC_00842]